MLVRICSKSFIFVRTYSYVTQYHIQCIYANGEEEFNVKSHLLMSLNLYKLKASLEYFHLMIMVNASSLIMN